MQGMATAIFSPGPARPMIAPVTNFMRLRIWLGLRADSSVWASSMIARSGHTVLPSERVNFMPRTRPVIPRTQMIALLAALALTAFAAQADDASTLAAMDKAGCMACHAKDKKLVGPSFQQIAAKYKGQDAAASLVSKVRLALQARKDL